MGFFSKKTEMVSPEAALQGRDREMPVPARHEVLGTPLRPPFPEGLEQIVRSWMMAKKPNESTFAST